MDAFEYALSFFSVLVGLAISDMASSLHRLMRHASTIRWCPLTLLAALYTALAAVTLWFDLWSVRDVVAIRSLFFYVTLVVEFLLIFLMAAASLPDESTAECDLVSYYDKNRRYFWILVMLFNISYGSHWLYFQSMGSFVGYLNGLPLIVTYLVVPPVLLIFGARWVHYTGVSILLVMLVWDHASTSLG